VSERRRRRRRRRRMGAGVRGRKVCVYVCVRGMM
jgi:hypothetical protein